MRSKKSRFTDGETSNKSRVKLHKSGKHWIRTVMSQIGLLRLFKGDNVAEDLVVNQVEEKTSSHHILKGAAALSAIVAGGLASSNALAESDSPAVETEQSTDNLATNDVVTMAPESKEGAVSEQASTSDVQADSASLSASTSLSESLSESVSESASESTHQSESLSTSESSSSSTQESESISNSESLSASENSAVDSTQASEKMATTDESSHQNEASSEVAESAMTTATQAAQDSTTVSAATENLLVNTNTLLQLGAATQNQGENAVSTNQLLEDSKVTASNRVRVRRSLTSGEDVTANLQNVQISFSDDTLKDPSVIDAGNGENLSISMSFNIDSVNEGDHFQIQLSDNLETNGTSPVTTVVPIKSSTGEIYATGVFDPDTHTVTYTFTQAASEKQNLEGYVELPVLVDDVTVPNSAYSVPFKATVGNTSASITKDVDYSADFHVAGDYKVGSRIVETNPDSSIKQVTSIS